MMGEVDCRVQFFKKLKYKIYSKRGNQQQKKGPTSSVVERMTLNHVVQGSSPWSGISVLV